MSIIGIIKPPTHDAPRPRPRINLVLYYGVFAPRAAGRQAIVPAPGAPFVIFKIWVVVSPFLSIRGIPFAWRLVRKSTLVH